MTRPWHNLPVEILELFALRLPLNELPRFALTCRAWRRSIPVHIHSTLGSPLLAYFPRNDGVCHLYSPLCDKTFVPHPDPPPILRRACPLSSKGGWLVLSQGVPEDTTILLYNPFSGSLRSFQMPFMYFFSIVGLSAPPTDPDFLFLVITFGYPREHEGEGDCREIEATLCRGDFILERLIFSNNLPFAPFDGCGPVFWNGRFYVLGKHGRLGVFDTTETTWTVLARPRCVHIQATIRDYLVECEGKLCWVFVCRTGEVRVLKLNCSIMEWEALEGTLEHPALFVGWPVSLSSTTVKGMHNRIYLPKFNRSAGTEVAPCQMDNWRDEPLFIVPKSSNDNDGESYDKNSQGSMLYYSTQSQRFHPANNALFQSTKEYTLSVWVEPRFTDSNALFA